MLVDRDKAIEACAKVCKDLADEGIAKAAAMGSAHRQDAVEVARIEESALLAAEEDIRQLTLEDCRVESTPHRKAVVDFLEQEANDLLAGKHKKGYRFREIADLIESLSAQVEEAKDYVSAVDEENNHLKRQVACKPISEVQGTHWEGCEQAHHGCALAKLDAALRRQEKI